MTLGQLERMIHQLAVEYGEDREVLTADHQSWITSATERIIGYYVYIAEPDSELPVILIYAGTGAKLHHEQTRG